MNRSVPDDLVKRIFAAAHCVNSEDVETDNPGFAEVRTLLNTLVFTLSTERDRAVEQSKRDYNVRTEAITERDAARAELEAVREDAAKSIAKWGHRAQFAEARSVSFLDDVEEQIEQVILNRGVETPDLADIVFVVSELVRSWLAPVASPESHPWDGHDWRFVYTEAPPDREDVFSEWGHHECECGWRTEDQMNGDRTALNEHLRELEKRTIGSSETITEEDV